MGNWEKRRETARNWVTKTRERETDGEKVGENKKKWWDTVTENHTPVWEWKRGCCDVCVCIQWWVDGNPPCCCCRWGSRSTKRRRSVLLRSGGKSSSAPALAAALATPSRTPRATATSWPPSGFYGDPLPRAPQVSPLWVVHPGSNPRDDRPDTVRPATHRTANRRRNPRNCSAIAPSKTPPSEGGHGQHSRPRHFSAGSLFLDPCNRFKGLHHFLSFFWFDVYKLTKSLQNHIYGIHKSDHSNCAKYIDVYFELLHFYSFYKLQNVGQKISSYNGL